MSNDEPKRLREWHSGTSAPGKGRLFTCGRPGRATCGTKKVKIGESIIGQWVNGLPQAECLYIVSLLGKKRNGLSEFSYYPFRSIEEAGTEPTFQEWLDQHYPQRFVVYEFPTTDLQGIPLNTLEKAKNCALNLLGEGHTVLIIDSGGSERTARVCEAMAYTW